MQPSPEHTVRHTVDQNGGQYTTDVPDLLALFGRQQLTDKARQEVRRALQSVDVGTDPDFLVATREDTIRLYVVQREWAARPTRRSSPLARFRPRTWKGWLAYGFIALVALSAAFGDSEAPERAVPASQTVDQSADRGVDTATVEARREARRERQRLRRERAELRRQQAAARRARTRARRERAAARERKRQEELAAQAAQAPEPEPEVQSLATNCHPSYDPCLDPNASDYDCSGGSGDGPEYTGPVTVKGADDYGLDADGDGTGCDS